MPSAADYERHARHALDRARRLHDLAVSIRSVAAPLATAFDPLSARHLEGLWLSDAAQRSRNELTSIKQRCASAHADSVSFALALDRAAAGLESDARSAERRADAARAEEKAEAEAEMRVAE